MDKLRSIKIKNLDGTYTEEVPVGVSIENVDYNDNKTLKQVLGNLDITKGTVEERLNFSEMKSISYDDLKTLRDGGKLVPGQSYRIIDYVCTTTQQESRAVEHPFDIIVWADDASTLNENARACKREGDEYYANCNFAAWELKYCLDNDTNRFAWADSENGHGVVYYMKDDHGNECPYDFKQIQFTRYKITECTVSSLVGKYTALQYGDAITGIDQQNPVWCYTFSYDPESTGVMSDVSVMEFNINNKTNVSENTIKTFFNYQDSDEEAGLLIALLNCIVLFGNNCSFNTFGNDCSANTFGNNCYFNTFGNICLYNTFGDNCSFNTFGNDCSANTFGNNCLSNTFENDCSANTFGNNCLSNTFGNDCSANTFGDKCNNNYFSMECSSNTFDVRCSRNKLLYSMTSENKLLSGITNNIDTVQYYTFLANVKNQTIQGTLNANSSIYVGFSSDGQLKTWNPADLVPAEENQTPTTEG